MSSHKHGWHVFRGGDFHIKGGRGTRRKFWKWPPKGTCIVRWWTWQWSNFIPKRDQSITSHFGSVDFFCFFVCFVFRLIFLFFDTSIKCCLLIWVYFKRSTVDDLISTAGLLRQAYTLQGPQNLVGIIIINTLSMTKTLISNPKRESSRVSCQNKSAIHVLHKRYSMSMKYL